MTAYSIDTSTFDSRQWDHWTVPEIAVVDGLETAYRRGGTGETVVYLHGGGNTRAWLPFHQKMAGEFDFIATEHPGFGDSPRPSRFTTWEDMILHYDGFFRALGLDRIHLVGNSLGALLAAKIAVQYPDRIRSLTLLTPVGLRIDSEPLRDVYRWTPEEADQALFNGRGADLADLLVQQGSPEDDVQAYREQTTSALLFWNPRYDAKLDHRLARVTAPVLSIGVDRDGVAGDMVAARYAELVPNGRFVTISGRPDAPSSHMVFLEQPEETASIISAHVRASI